MFYRGQLVACIDDDWSTDLPVSDVLPVRGVVYTVRTITADKDGEWLRLVEIINADPDEKHEEAMFDSDCFRPLDDSKLSIFRNALEPIKKREVA